MEGICGTASIFSRNDLAQEAGFKTGFRDSGVDCNLHVVRNLRGFDLTHYYMTLCFGKMNVTAIRKKG